MPIRVPPISRRRFLAASLAAAAGSAVGRRSLAAEPGVDPHRFALLADTHLWEHRDREKEGVRPADNFIQARGQILALEARPAGVIVAGDCACVEGRAADYAVLAELVGPLRKAGLPMHFALGNHDHRERFHEAFPETRPPGKPAVVGKFVSIVSAPRANWFLLDSLKKTNFTPGELGKAQLDWLADALDAHADRPALLVAHHDLGARDGSLLDTEALLEVIVRRRQVKAYFYGHTHAWGHSERDGIHLVNLPTTVWLFDSKQLRGWVDAQLEPDGATLTLHALDPAHPAHGQRPRLQWRT